MISRSHVLRRAQVLDKVLRMLRAQQLIVELRAVHAELSS